MSFGPDGSSWYLRRMAEIAREVQNNAPRDPLVPVAATIFSSYTQALDTVGVHPSRYRCYMYTNRTLIMLGPTRGDVPRYRRVVAKAQRGTDALKLPVVCRILKSMMKYVSLVKCSEGEPQWLLARTTTWKSNLRVGIPRSACQI